MIGSENMDDLIKAINEFKKEFGEGNLLCFAYGWMNSRVESEDEKIVSSKKYTSKDVLKLLEVLRENA